MKKRLLLVLLVITLLFISSGCKKEQPFMEKYDVKYSKSTDTIKAPIYAYSQDENGEEKKFDDIEFIQNDATFTFSDWNISKEDKNGEVILSYKCKIDGKIEYYSSHKGKWFYSFVYSTPELVDYYSGDIYLKNTVSEDGSTNILSNGIDSLEEKNKYKYTLVSFNKETTKIGVLYNNKFLGWQEKQDLGTENGRKHIIVPVSVEIYGKIKMPKNYDGVVVAVRKSGVTEESYTKDKEEYNKLVKLQKESKEKGKKNKELIEYEKEKDTVHKLIDKDDKIRKDVKIDDYYYIKTKDLLKIKKEKKGFNIKSIFNFKKKNK